MWFKGVKWQSHLPVRTAKWWSPHWTSTSFTLCLHSFAPNSVSGICSGVRLFPSFGPLPRMPNPHVNNWLWSTHTSQSFRQQPSSFNSTKRRAQSSIISYTFASDLPLRKLNYVLFFSAYSLIRDHCVYDINICAIFSFQTRLPATLIKREHYRHQSVLVITLFFCERTCKPGGFWTSALWHLPKGSTT